MGNVKGSQLPEDIAPALVDLLLGLKEGGTPTTETFPLSALLSLFFNNIPAGSIGNTDLATNIFKNLITSYTNAGSAGGTGYYFTLGGIKFCFGKSNTCNVSGVGQQFATYNVDYPSSFFTATYYENLFMGQIVNSQAVTVHQNGGDGSTFITGEIWQGAGTNGGGKFNWLAIGY